MVTSFSGCTLLGFGFWLIKKAKYYVQRRLRRRREEKDWQPMLV